MADLIKFLQTTILITNGTLFLGGKKANQKLYSLPNGNKEGEETSPQAMVRVLDETTGLDIREWQMKRLQSLHLSGNKELDFYVKFTNNLPPLAVLHNNKEPMQYKYIERKDIKKLVYPEFRKLLPLVFKKIDSLRLGSIKRYYDFGKSILNSTIFTKEI